MTPGPENPSPPTEPSPGGKSLPGGSLFWAFVVLVVAGLIVYGGFLWMGKRTLDTAAQGIETTIETTGRIVTGVAEAFRPESITQTFIQYTELAVKGTEGNILEVATAEANETFTRSTNLVWFDRVVPFGTTVAEISVPATYRYHIDLHREWDIAAYDGRVTVVAPPIQPSLPIAFDSAGMQKKTKSGWARWDGNENLEELERGLTQHLEERARAPETIAKVREAARLAVANFVRNWLLTGEHWGESTYREIVVVFPDEVGQPDSPALSERPSTLRWKPEKGGVESVLP